MSKHNPYAFLTLISMRNFRDLEAAEKAAQRPRLALVTPDTQTTQTINTAKSRKPKMTKPTDHEAARAAKREALGAILKDANDAITPPAAPVFSKLQCLRLVDHVNMVHNALDAVRCLVITSIGAGINDDMGNIGRNQFVDLLEILNDRLGAALEIEEQRTA